MKGFESTGEILEGISHGDVVTRQSGIIYSKGREPLTANETFVIGTAFNLSGSAVFKRENKMKQFFYTFKGTITGTAIWLVGYWLFRDWHYSALIILSSAGLAIDLLRYERFLERLEWKISRRQYREIRNKKMRAL